MRKKGFAFKILPLYYINAINILKKKTPKKFQKFVSLYCDNEYPHEIKCPRCKHYISFLYLIIETNSRKPEINQIIDKLINGEYLCECCMTETISNIKLYSNKKINIKDL